MYILDELESALSPARQLAILGRIHELVERNSQFIISTHSPIISAYPNARIYHIDENGLAPITYGETEHYSLTKGFLNNPQRYLELLLDPSD